MKKTISIKHINLRIRVKSKTRNFAVGLLDKLKVLDKSFLESGFNKNIKETLFLDFKKIK